MFHPSNRALLAVALSITLVAVSLIGIVLLLNARSSSESGGEESAPAPTSLSSLDRVEQQAGLVNESIERVPHGGAQADSLQMESVAEFVRPESAPRPQSSQGTTTVSGSRQPAPSSTTFQDNLRSRVVSASNDAVSTFSLDTDRTSYQLALNWFNNGFNVDPESVRAEEWINAFDYGYAQPLRDDNFAISSALIPHPLDARKHLARIAVQAPELVDDTPLNVTLVLDASGSMAEGGRVAIARAAALSIVQSLGPNDRIAVVQFTTDVIDELTVYSTDPSDSSVRRAIEALVPREQTNVQAGLDLGVALADQARRERPDAYNYVILMSDGVANVDATDPFAILESTGEFDATNPIRLITIGVGIGNFNDQLLEQLAQHGNGWYRYLSNTDQARYTFSRENWLALSVPFADQTRAQVTWDESVVDTWRLIGYENRVTSDASFDQARREFAEIPAGAATTVFYELELHRPRVLQQQSLGEIELRWDTPLTGESNRQHAVIAGRSQTQFAADDEALLRFGAIVALASDRYSALLSPEHDGYALSNDLSTLQTEMQRLEGSLGRLDAYWDFAVLLDHLIAVPALVADPPTGYSP